MAPTLAPSGLSTTGVAGTWRIREGIEQIEGCREITTESDFHFFRRIPNVEDEGRPVSKRIKNRKMHNVKDEGQE